MNEQRASSVTPAAGAPSAAPSAPLVWHAGEVELQHAAGSAEQLARVGSQIMRSQLSEQQRAFFALLPLIIVGSLDASGQPIASLLTGPPGFVSSPDPRTLRVNAPVLAGDPLGEQLQIGAPLALLGIMPHTRRRNRANGRVKRRDAAGFELGVAQSFGNCPKYITPRELEFAGSRAPGPVSVHAALTPAQRDLLERADTFFIASAHPDAARSLSPAHGLDVSHRGGPPGFIHFIDDATFIIPDLRGNDFYNTLGNLKLEPRAGLLFIDFARGDLLSLEAIVEPLAGVHPSAHELVQAAATGRIVRVRIQRARAFPHAAALRVAPAQT